MKRRELQQIIGEAESAQTMVQIARAYLDGDVLRDKTAAEAWLTRAVAAEDPVWSAVAMGILAREILGREQALSPEDRADICRDLAQADPGERDALLALLEPKRTEKNINKMT